MSEVKKFDHVLFGQLEVVLYQGEVYFMANEVVRILEHSNPSKAIKDHCKCMIKLNYNETLLLGFEGKIKGLQIIPEHDVYRLVMRSKLPQAEQFQDWVMEEVLPTLRKTGGYVSGVDQIIETFYKNEQPHIKEVIRAGLNFQKNNQHKIDFADDVSDVVNLRTMNDVAKAFNVGRNKMFAKLRDMSILDINNTPYQTYITRGYFKVNQVTKFNYLHNVTLVTGKGELWLHKKLKEVNFI